MQTALAIGIMIAVESAAIVWASQSDHDGNLRMISLINMVLIILFGRALLDLGAGITNIGCICYATVVCGQCVVLVRHGIEAKRRTIGMVNWTLIWLFAGMACMDFFPVIPTNEPFREHMHTIAYWTPRIASGSFAAFFLGQETLGRTWLLFRARHSQVTAIVLASLACQAVDTPIFFGVAFLGDMPGDQMVEAMAIGFLFKGALTIAFIPAFVLASMKFNPADLFTR